MKNKKTLSAVFSILMIVSIIGIIVPSTAAVPVVCTVRGYVYIDGVITTPDEVKLTFTGDPYIADLYPEVPGYYAFTVEEESGSVGTFLVTYLGVTYSVTPGTVQITSPDPLRINLTVDTSTGGLSDDDDDVTPPDDDDDVTPPPSDDDDDTGGGGGGGGGGGTTSDDDDYYFPGGGGTYVAPVANASLSETVGLTEDEIRFDGSLSTGSITSYSWDFGDGNTGTGEITSHAYLTANVYTVVLTVSDGSNSDTDTITVTITKKPNNPPTKPTLTGPATGNKNTEYNYEAVSTDLDNDTLQYEFNFGDQDLWLATLEFLPNGTTDSINHTWTAAGLYTVKVRAYDNETYSETTELEVLIDSHKVTDIGYMTDDDGDGIYDTFHSLDETVITDVEKLENGTYLIDSTGDGEWDWFYYPDTDTLHAYSEPAGDSMLLMLGVGMIIVIALLLIIALAAKKKKKQQQPPKKKK